MMVTVMSRKEASSLLVLIDVPDRRLAVEDAASLMDVPDARLIFLPVWGRQVIEGFL